MKLHWSILLVACLLTGEIRAEGIAPTREYGMAKDLSFRQNLGAALPLDATFVDSAGKTVRLGDFFNKGPVILAMAYYRCKNICTVVFRETFQTLERVKFDVPDAYQIVFISIDPSETPEMAAKKRRTYLRTYNRQDLETGTHFLTGPQESIAAVADAIGFEYRYDEPTRQYIHPAGIVVATPEGTLSRYLYGIRFDPRDLRLALVEASAGAIGNPVDQFLLYCYEYDPTQGKYGVVVMNLVRLGAGATMTGLAAFIFVMLRRERRRKNVKKEG